MWVLRRQFSTLAEVGRLLHAGGERKEIQIWKLKKPVAFVRKPILELTEDEFMANLNVSAYVSFLFSLIRSGFDSFLHIYSKGAFLFTQAALPLLLNATNGQHPPTLIYTGATASVKSSANMAAFSTGKYALRALSQSVAKEYGPKGEYRPLAWTQHEISGADRETRL